MKVECDKMTRSGAFVRKEADIAVVGVCIALTVGASIFRVKLTKQQWGFLAQSATRIASGEPL